MVEIRVGVWYYYCIELWLGLNRGCYYAPEMADTLMRTIFMNQIGRMAGD
ncbi:MAG: hypothetical protein IKM61_00155 [Eubacteriaceae bacterium]|nr:hypothetical protein [Eubacteriaceae bacterium]